MKTRIIGLIAIILLSLSCKKEYEFPDITQEGKGTFGCKIDGRIYVPKADIRPFNTHIISRLDLLDDGMINMAISVLTESMGRLTIRYRGEAEGLRPGTFPMQNPLLEAGGYSAEYYYGSGIYRTDSGQPGSIAILRFDPDEQIISATFQFTLMDHSTGESVEVTEGRFDIKILNN